MNENMYFYKQVRKIVRQLCCVFAFTAMVQDTFLLSIVVALTSWMAGQDTSPHTRSTSKQIETRYYVNVMYKRFRAYKHYHIELITSLRHQEGWPTLQPD